ncbi:MAG: MerR family transcriptional regulator [Planctomycetota bacterium]|nr:MerR family transcriptional regulator [Planctomycetota bacterium]
MRVTMPDPRWTMEGLCQQVEWALTPDYEGPANGQVRAVPDARTIRYYTTLGLLDRPAEMRGRTAYYGRRHLLQIVAIKRMQAQGLPLAAIQERLVGLSNTVLEDLAHLPKLEDVFAAAGGVPSPRTADEDAFPASVCMDKAPEVLADRRKTAFWNEEPAALPKREAEPARVRTQGVDLDGKTLLLLSDVPTLSDEDIEVLRRAAAPLLEVLRARGLTKEGHV